MVQGRQILIFYTIIVHIANDCRYKILRFWANPQKNQTLVPAKNSHLKVHMWDTGQRTRIVYDNVNGPTPLYESITRGVQRN